MNPGGGGPPIVRQMLPLDIPWTPTTDAMEPQGGLRGGPRVCITCSPGDLVEGEPDCANGYVDAYNGGCNSTPNVVGEIRCGRTVCGKYGTFLSATGANFRDTDWYQFTINQASDVTWTATGEATTRVFILQGTCPAVSLGTASAAACAPATVTLTNLPAGTYYAFVATEVFTGVPCGTPYRATLTTSTCCTAALARAGDLPENEPLCQNGYVDATNGGCNSTPNVFGITACGITVAGTYGTYLSPGGANFRDTDWYRFTLERTGTVRWTAVGEARTRVYILQAACPTTTLGTAVADPCLPATVTLTNLAPGTYYAFVGTDVFSGVPCDSRYRATLSTTDCPCPADWDRNGLLTPADVAAFVSNWFATLTGGC
jgi:hypothetical protein